MPSVHRQTLPEPDPLLVAQAALQSFFALSERWGLTAIQERVLLGDPPSSTFFRWKSARNASRLSRDTLDRISYLLGIHKALRVLLPTEEAAYRWVAAANDAAPFGGQPALDHMLGGSVTDIADVRRYLDAQRG